MMSEIEKYNSFSLVESFSSKLNRLENDDFGFLFARAKHYFEKSVWDKALSEFLELLAVYPVKIEIYPFLSYLSYINEDVEQSVNYLLTPLGNFQLGFFSDLFKWLPINKWENLYTFYNSKINGFEDLALAMALITYKLDKDSEVVDILSKCNFNVVSFEFYRLIMLGFSTIFEKKDYNYAIELFEKAKKTNSAHQYPNYGMALVAEKTEDFSTAIDILSEILITYKHPYIYSRRGNLYRKTENYCLAENDLKKAIELSEATDWDDLLCLGKVYLKMKDYKVAKIQLDKANTIHECDETLQALGNLHYDIGEFEKALIYYNNAISCDPNYASFYFCASDTLVAMRRWTEALEYINKAIELEPLNDFYYSYKADIYIDINEYDKTIECLTKAIEINPDECSYLLRRGNLLFNTSKLEDALIDFSKCIALDSTNYKTFFYKGKCLQELNRIDEAIKYLNKSIEINENDQAHYLLGRIFFNNDQNDIALEHFQQAVKLATDNDDYYRWIAVALSFMNRLDDSLVNISRAIELDNSNATYYYIRASILSDLKDYANAIKDSTKAVELQPDDHSNYLKRGHIYSIMQEHNNALADLLKSIELGGENAFTNCFYYTAIEFLHLSDGDNALFYINKAIDKNNSNENYYELRANLYFNLKAEYQKGIEDLTIAINLNPNEDNFYYKRGIGFLNLNQYESAIEDFSKAIQLNSDNLGALYYRGRCYHASSKFDESKADYLNALELGAESVYPEIFFNLTQACVITQDFASGSKYSKEALKINDQNSLVWCLHAACCFQKDEIQEALFAYKKAYSFNDELKDTILLDLSRIYEKTGEYELALSTINEAVDLKPIATKHYFQRARIQLMNRDIAAAVSDILHPSGFSENTDSLFHPFFNDLIETYPNDLLIMVNEMIAIYPDSTTLIAFRSLVYKKLDRLVECFDDFRLVLKKVKLPEI